MFLSKKNHGFFAGILLAILPKCPFCVMGFSSAVVLCSKDAVIENQTTHNSPLTIGLTAFFCLLTITAILLNFRGNRTKYALALAAAGILPVMYSVIREGGFGLYYVGVALLFIAVWLNGSMIWFLDKIKEKHGKIPESSRSSVPV